MNRRDKAQHTSSKVKTLAASFMVLLSLTSCSLATVGKEEEEPPPIGNPEARSDVYYDGLLSSEMRNLMGLFQSYLLDNPDDFEGAGTQAKESYKPFEGVQWDYEILESGGYLIKVWTPAGGTSTSEETALVYDSTTRGFR